MKTVGIVGCGYAGLSAAWKLSALKNSVKVTVFDKSAFFHFLPLLPDVVGRGIPASAMRYPIDALAKRYSFEFLHEEARSVDLVSRSIKTASLERSFDYLVLSSGTETNFYGNDLFRDLAYKLDDSFDVEHLYKRLKQFDYKRVIVSGGGYTGIEIATNIRRFFLNSKKDLPVTLVERASGILGPLPEWMKQYVSMNLKHYNVEVLCNTTIDKVEPDTVLVWTAGVKTPAPIQELSVNKNPQGRLKVEANLSISDNCFAVGDSSIFESKQGPLRMAVQFAIAEGKHAALNIKCSLKGEALLDFKPFDFGYIIPMANNAACGRILNMNMRGFPCIIFHYMMCIWRAYGLSNKLAILERLLKGGLL